MENKYSNKKVKRPAIIYKLISNFRNKNKKNMLRGYSAKHRLNSKEIEQVRRGNSSHDSMLVGQLLKGPNGLINDGNPKKKRMSHDLFTMTTFPHLGWKSEVAYTSGYVNSMLEAALEILDILKDLAGIEYLNSECAIEKLLDLSKKHGASNYLSYKLAYLTSSRELDTALLGQVSKIEAEIGLRDNAGLYFSALENLSSRISLFVVAQRRVSGLVGKVNGDFRKSLSLNNFIPTPIDVDDVAGYLLRATESCLTDTIYALFVIFNLSNELHEVKREFEQCLMPEFLSKFKAIIVGIEKIEEGEIVTKYYREKNQDADPTLNLYRVSSALLERPKLAIYRSKIDRVIGVRLLAEIIDNRLSEVSSHFNCREYLLAKNLTPIDGDLNVTLDTFYRTFLFLMFIEDRMNILTLSRDDIKFIFENTISLDVLLTEDEMRALYLTAPNESKNLVTVLALALFRSKSIDPDIDFEFRTGFISHVKDKFNGSIINFIEYLLIDSPQVANYIVSSLDEVTLEKMYTLVTNASQAAQIRCDILRAVGQKLSRIEYFIEADAIDTRTKLSKLQQYFDSSRMYVDSVSMKKWLDSNPSIATEQYRSLYPRIETRISSISSEIMGEPDLLVIHVSDQGEYLISQIAKDAFEQFCLNAEFGIQSYLGRRIRHNTLDGVTTDTVDAVLRNPSYRAAIANASMRRTVDAWMASYKTIIDKLKKDYLQFGSINSLFNATLDLEDSSTKENVRILFNTLISAGGSELLNDMVIAFCWRQIAPQLENASRFIKTKLLQQANSSIDKHFSGYFGEIELQIKSELHEAVNEVFKKIADWFRLPQTGFISASVRDLCQIIQLELGRQNGVEFLGNSVSTKYTGISVHRLYDCLAVLIKNAHIYGKTHSPILVEVNNNENTIQPLNGISVSISSYVADENFETSKERISKAIASEETDTDMVTEGYTGIKKIKYITRTSEGKHTMRFDANPGTKMLTLEFSVHAETALENTNEGFNV